MQDKAENQAGVWGRNVRKCEGELLTMQEENNLIPHCSGPRCNGSRRESALGF